MRTPRLAGMLAIFCAIAACPAVAAAVPATVTHQGRLYTASDAPVTGSIDVVFAIYDAEGAATPLWSEKHTVAFDDGYFSVSLGDVTPLDTAVLDGSVRYLGITVGTDPEFDVAALEYN